MIVHHQGVLPQVPGNAEGERIDPYRADIHDARKASGSPGGGQGNAIQHVIDDFVLIQVPG